MFKRWRWILFTSNMNELYVLWAHQCVVACYHNSFRPVWLRSWPIQVSLYASSISQFETRTHGTQNIQLEQIYSLLLFFMTILDVLRLSRSMHFCLTGEFSGFDDSFELEKFHTLSGYYKRTSICIRCNVTNTNMNYRYNVCWHMARTCNWDCIDE